MMLFLTFAVVGQFDALLLFLCAVLFLAVAFVRFTVAKLGLLAAGKGFRSLRRATGALPLDPATFEKVDETFSFFAFLLLLFCFCVIIIYKGR